MSQEELIENYIDYIKRHAYSYSSQIESQITLYLNNTDLPVYRRLILVADQYASEILRKMGIKLEHGKYLVTNYKRLSHMCRNYGYMRNHEILERCVKAHNESDVLEVARIIIEMVEIEHLYKNYWFFPIDGVKQPELFDGLSKTPGHYLVKKHLSKWKMLNQTAHYEKLSRLIKEDNGYLAKSFDYIVSN